MRHLVTNMNQTFSFRIQEGAKTRQEGTFWVPSGCLHLSLTYDLSPAYTFLVFLLLRDPHGKLRFQKQLAHGEPVICLGQNGMDTTIGGVPGDLPEGKWTLEICLFAEHLDRILNGKCIDFTVSVSDKAEQITESVGSCVWTNRTFAYEFYKYDRIYQNGCKWYKGDFHTHTRLSDGKETTANATRKAEHDGLDYYVPTEHNVVHTGWQDTSVMIVPGVEVTTTLGHANLFGLTERPETLDRILFDKKREELEEDLESVLKECRKHGWLFSVNHPFLHIWKWLYDDLKLSDVDSLEIINDPTYAADPEAQAEEANRKAVRLSDLLWADGYRICAVGGSDSHNLLDERYGDAKEPSVPGDPATWLYMDALSPQNLLKAVKKCHAYVTRHCRIEVSLKADRSPAFFGDQFPDGTVKELSYEICMKDLKEEPEVFFYHNGVCHRCICTMEEQGVYMVKGTVAIQKETYNWIRFGAETKSGQFLFYANPVTVGYKKKHQFITFGEIKAYDQRNLI